MHRLVRLQVAPINNDYGDHVPDGRFPPWPLRGLRDGLDVLIWGDLASCPKGHHRKVAARSQQRPYYRQNTVGKGQTEGESVDRVSRRRQAAEVRTTGATARRLR